MDESAPSRDTQLRLEALRLAISAAEYQAAPNEAVNVRATARVFYDFLRGDKELSEGDSNA